MKNLVRPLAALVVTVFVGGVAFAANVASGFGTESYSAQIGYDSFNLSVKKRMEATRVGSVGRTFAAAAFSSDSALAAAPSSRSETIYGSRRQLDCVYYSGFTVWGDLYHTWAGQRSKDGADGFKYRITGPALGFDWTNGKFTVGAATTYGWGRIKSRDYDNKRKNRMWALTLYGQYDTENYYVNATAGYAYNRYRASGGGSFLDPAGDPFSMGYNDRFSGNAWNLNGEFGYKFHFGAFKVVPNVGLRYFHDRVGSFSESGSGYRVETSPRNYHVLELPIGVNLSYEIAAGGSIIVPRFRAAWIPELSRKRGGWSGTLYDGTNAWGVGETTARRSRHSFQVGAGIEAKITKAISAHVDYNFNFRSRYYEHHLNLGLGFTF